MIKSVQEFLIGLGVHAPRQESSPQVLALC
jgi:hypothetical protein